MSAYVGSSKNLKDLKDETGVSKQVFRRGGQLPMGIKIHGGLEIHLKRTELFRKMPRASQKDGTSDACAGARDLDRNGPRSCGTRTDPGVTAELRKLLEAGADIEA